MSGSRDGRTADAIIVGGGIVGAAIAWLLARDGMSVDVLDSGFPAGGTTAGGMGHIVVMDDSPAQLALTRYSQVLVDGLADELPVDVELDRCGTLWVAEDDDQLAAARAKLDYYTSHDIPAEMLDARQTAEAEPELRSGLAGALRVPGDSVLYPPTMTKWLLQRATERGARVLPHTHVQEILPGGVRVDGRRIDAGIVVNASGAAAAQLTPGLDIVPRKGHLVITDRYPGFCRHQLVELGYLKSAHTLDAASVAFNLQPRKTGQMLIGSSRELVGWDGSMNRAVLTRMLKRAIEFTPRLKELRAVRTWTAFRPATPDKLPYVGPWQPQEGVWIAAGHEGLGITTALGTAALLADLVAGRPTAIDAAPFSPDRALTGSRS